MLKQLSKLSIAASAFAAVGFASTHNAKADQVYTGFRLGQLRPS
jgi:hypothetical protein